MRWGWRRPADASEQEFFSAYNKLYDNLGDIASGDDKAAIEAFSTYAGKTCPMELPDMPDLDDEMSDLESQMESQMGELTELPSS